MTVPASDEGRHEPTQEPLWNESWYFDFATPDGLWAQPICETPHEHWTLGLEAFGVALDDPAVAYHGERGDRVALGLDLEWEAVAPAQASTGLPRYEQPCAVHGDVLVGDERL